jgi:WD40 repeat protein
MLCLRGHTAAVLALAYAPDGRLLASGSLDRTLRLWDTHSRREVAVLPDHGNFVTGVAFAPDGRTLASIGSDSQVRVWDVAERRQRLSLPRQQNLNALAFFPDGRRLAAGAGFINCLAVHPDGTTIAAGAGQPSGRGHGVVRVWDLTAGAELPRLEVSDVGRWSVVHTPQHREYPDVKQGGGLRVVMFWRPGEIHPLPSLPLRHPPLAIAFSPDGKSLASAAASTIRLWDPARGYQRAVLKGHARDVTTLAFTPVGRGLLSGSADRSVRLWDAESGRPRSGYRWPVGKVFSVVVSPDGLTAASAGDAGDIVVWDLDG